MRCRALLDTGATGSYVSAFLVNFLKVKPSRTLTRGIKRIMGWVTKLAETYDVKIRNTHEKCVLPICVAKIEPCKSSTKHHNKLRKYIKNRIVPNTVLFKRLYIIKKNISQKSISFYLQWLVSFYSFFKPMSTQKKT